MQKIKKIHIIKIIACVLLVAIGVISGDTRAEGIVSTKISISAITTANAYFNYGVRLSKQGKHEQAIVYFQKAISLNPDSVRAHRNISDAYMDLGKHDQAGISMQKARNLDYLLIKRNHARANPKADKADKVTFWGIAKMLGIGFVIWLAISGAEKKRRRSIGETLDTANTLGDIFFSGPCGGGACGGGACGGG